MAVNGVSELIRWWHPPCSLSALFPLISHLSHLPHSPQLSHSSLCLYTYQSSDLISLTSFLSCLLFPSSSFPHVHHSCFTSPHVSNISLDYRSRPRTSTFSFLIFLIHVTSLTYLIPFAPATLFTSLISHVFSFHTSLSVLVCTAPLSTPVILTPTNYFTVFSLTVPYFHCHWLLPMPFLSKFSP